MWVITWACVLGTAKETLVSPPGHFYTILP